MCVACVVGYHKMGAVPGSAGFFFFSSFLFYFWIKYLRLLSYKIYRDFSVDSVFDTNTTVQYITGRRARITSFTSPAISNPPAHRQHQTPDLHTHPPGAIHSSSTGYSQIVRLSQSLNPPFLESPTNTTTASPPHLPRTHPSPSKCRKPTPPAPRPFPNPPPPPSHTQHPAAPSRCSQTSPSAWTRTRRQRTTRREMSQVGSGTHRRLRRRVPLVGRERTAI